MNFAKSCLVLACASLASSAVAQSPSYDGKAPIAFMTDLSSGAVLFERDADKRIPPASMAKMMTVYVAFDQIAKGKLSLDRKVPMTDDVYRKWARQGSTMFLEPDDKPTVSDLLHGVVTLSGNDASALLAKAIGGSESGFVKLMNQQAKKLGLSGSHFGNSKGWPDGGKTYVTARDLATLARRTIEDHPKLYKQFYDQNSFEWNDIKQPNRNPLLGKVEGADGLKTGHTEEAGYGFTGSAEQSGRRLVSVIAGLDSYGGRSEEAVNFMQWGFDAWESEKLFSEGRKVGEAEVQMGSSRSVPLVAPSNLGVTFEKGQVGDYQLFIRYTGPLKAPIAKGDRVAELVVKAGGKEQVMPLVAGESVAEAGFFTRIWNGLVSLFG